MSASPWFSEEERHAWTPFVVGALHLLSVLDADLRASVGLSHLDYGIMMLTSQSSTQIMRMSALADAFGVDPSNITYRVRRLEARGLVTRSTSPLDGRVINVQVTHDGLVLLRAAQRVHVASARRHFLDHLDADQLHAIATIFTALRASQQPATEDAYVEYALPANDETPRE